MGRWTTRLMGSDTVMKMRKIINYIIVALAAMVCLGCERPYEIVDDLGVSSHTLNISQTPGSTHIAVYSTGPWSISLDRHVDWASINKLSGEGLGDFVLSWSANYGIARSIDVHVSKEGRTETIHVIQAGLVESPYITLDRSVVVSPLQSHSFRIPMSTNLGNAVDDVRWRATSADGSPATWISACEIGPDHVEFTIDANGTGEDREAQLTVYLTAVTGTETTAAVNVRQSASNPTIALEAAEGNYYANGSSYLVPSTENNIWSLDGVQFSASGPWINGLSLDEEGLRFHADENTSGNVRDAVITVSYTSEGAPEASATYTVHQEVSKLLSFQDLRSRVPGIIRGSILLEGIMVSDHESPNLCSSPQTGRFAYDREENYRTAYLESTDGTYGVCLKFADKSDNVIPGGTKVLMSLDGVLLERASSPMRYTLSGITRDNFLDVEEGVGIPEKTKTVGQLSDADVYTYVTLPQVEVMSKDGCYTNTSEGYCLLDEINSFCGTALPRWDVAPLLCSDVNGDAIFMLTNAACPWRRTGQDVEWGSVVPQGSGNLSGIIVADEVAPVRWGKLGKYQIRPMSEEAIALDQPAFSIPICEWTWNGNFQTDERWAGDKGALKWIGAKTEFTWDYNNPLLPLDDTPNGYDTDFQKGIVKNGARSLTQCWWDFELNTGKYFDVEFSTDGRTGSNLVIGIVWGHGNGTNNSDTSVSAPSHWKVLYSTDGLSFSELTSAGILTQRTCAWWTQTLQDSTPGYTEHLVKLPSSCFDKKKVVVRFQAADLVTDIPAKATDSNWRTALGIEKGTINKSSTGTVRIGSIIVRYN